jgi:GT2 family glycosyltransferase
LTVGVDSNSNFKTTVPVIVLNWNGWEDTFRCLRSLLVCDEVREVWLIDNRSEVDRSDEARALFPGLHVLQLNDNYGWAGAYNRALQLAIEKGYCFAYLLNNDTSTKPGFLTTLLDVAERFPDAAAVGSTVLYGDPDESVMFDGTFHDRHVRSQSSLAGVASSNTLSGAGMLIRLSTVTSCGAFDERFFCYYEDTEWCFRVRNAGYKVLLAHESIILHRSQASDQDRNADYYSTRNAILFFMITTHSRASVLLHAYQSLRQASALRLRGDRVGAVAISQGLVDGLTNKFGPRHELTLAGRFIPYIWPFRQGYFRDLLPLLRH